MVALDVGGAVVSTSKAIDGETFTLGRCLICCVASLLPTSSRKSRVSNFKGVKVPGKVVKKARKLKAGKSLKLRAKAVKKAGTKVRGYAKLRYESSDPAVAAVSAKGVVKGVSKGTAYVYAYAQNGLAKRVKVVVR